MVGQTTAVLVVYFGLDYELPIWACLAVIALAAWLNVALRIRFPMTQRLEPDRAAWLLAFDIAELAVLLFFTGGLQNPFAFLFLGPVLISATALPPQMTLMLGGFAIACATVLVFVHDPLPWDNEPPLELPAVYVMGVWLSILLSIAFIGLHAWQITEESRQLADALAATELVLAREQHLSQLDGLAAAAAHELGTARHHHADRQGAAARNQTNSEHADDVRLLNEQAKRCRAILSKLTELSSGDPFDRMKLSLIEEVVAPHRNFGVAIDVALAAAAPPNQSAAAIRRSSMVSAICSRTPSTSRMSGSVAAFWSGQEIAVTIPTTAPACAGDHGADRRAVCHQPPARASERRRRCRRPRSQRSRARLLHCQDAAGTIGACSISRTVVSTAGRSSGCTGRRSVSSAPWHLRPDPGAH